MTQSPQNPFADMFKQFADKDYFQNMQKQFMNFDMNNISEMAQRNMDTAMKASQIAVENGQAIMKRAAEISQRQISEAVEATRDFMASSNPELAMQRQQQFMKNSTSNMISNSKELAEMSTKSVMEVFDIFSKRMNENVEAVNPVKKNNSK